MSWSYFVQVLAPLSFTDAVSRALPAEVKIEQANGMIYATLASGARVVVVPPEPDQIDVSLPGGTPWSLGTPRIQTKFIVDIVGDDDDGMQAGDAFSLADRLMATGNEDLVVVEEDTLRLRRINSVVERFGSALASSD